MHQIIQELPLILATRLFDHIAIAVLETSLKLACILAPIFVKFHPLAMFLTFKVFAFIYPFDGVVSEHSLAMRKAVLPLSFIDVATSKNHPAFTTWLVKSEGSLVN